MQKKRGRRSYMGNKSYFNVVTNSVTRNGLLSVEHLNYDCFCTITFSKSFLTLYALYLYPGAFELMMIGLFMSLRNLPLTITHWPKKNNIAKKTEELNRHLRCDKSSFFFCPGWWSMSNKYQVNT